MFDASRNLQLKIITGLIFVGLVGCNAEQKLPSNPTEIQPPTAQPEVPNSENDKDDDDKEPENDSQDNDKEDND
ncbi:hypothetical protein [Nostoc parmelioides]|uniref:Lipoprotein n=1 Tax=Nostoc parmelioides FACHB-3921 TaxID=2692909 RepID=A0ABR8BFL2_9NOSO|nr:hypothetical protein [Nostoc parmelioides]MBD2252570.1 hypothetical protein [Nostoc parmelioides FACHB-3921]